MYTKQTRFLIAGLVATLAFAGCTRGCREDAGEVLAAIARAFPPVEEWKRPGRLAIYFGFPSKINDKVPPAHRNVVGTAGTQEIWDLSPTGVDIAAAEFARYDVIVFGDTLQLDQHDINEHGTSYVYAGACPNQQVTHLDHDNAARIIQKLTGTHGKEVYGYVSVGGQKTNRSCPYGVTPAQPAPLTLDEIKNFVMKWRAMGVTGIFLDEAEYDFGASRARQNAAIDFIHAQTQPGTQKPLRVFINSWNPEDVLDSATTTTRKAVAPVSVTIAAAGATATVTHNRHGLVTGDQVRLSNMSAQVDKEVAVLDANRYTIPFHSGDPQGFAQSQLLMNPGGVGTSLAAGDLYLLEHFQLIQGAEEDHHIRAQNAANLRPAGVRIAAIPTAKGLEPRKAACSAAIPDCCFESDQYCYALMSTLLYDFDYVGWGEAAGFSANWPCAHQIPDTRPHFNVFVGTSFTSGVQKSGTMYTRSTDFGTIELESTLGSRDSKFTFGQSPPFATPRFVSFFAGNEISCQ